MENERLPKYPQDLYDVCADVGSVMQGMNIDAVLITFEPLLPFSCIVCVEIKKKRYEGRAAAHLRRVLRNLNRKKK